jgi:RNA polymerase sigma-70 factor (ECF subfamily)
MPSQSTAMNAHDTLEARRARFAELLARHQGLLRKIAWGFSTCAADRADLMQDMAAQLWAVFAQWDASRPFSTWAYRVALNVALGARRRADAPPTIAIDDALAASLADTDAAPEQHVGLQELGRAVASLDPLNRALLLLYLDDLPYREIGEILGLTETHVGVRLNRLKQRLRARMETP